MSVPRNDHESTTSAVFRTLFLMMWALWFGGVMGLFLSVQVLFRGTDRETFLAAAPKLFLAFERYQLILASLGLVSIVGWRIAAPASKATALFVLLAIASLGAVAESTLITPRLEAMRMQGQTRTPEFLRLHGLSMSVYLVIAITLLAAGIFQSLTSSRTAAKSE